MRNLFTQSCSFYKYNLPNFGKEFPKNMYVYKKDNINYNTK